jgi:hypothetical protein
LSLDSSLLTARSRAMDLLSFYGSHQFNGCLDVARLASMERFALFLRLVLTFRAHLL